MRVHALPTALSRSLRGRLSLRPKRLDLRLSAAIGARLQHSAPNESIAASIYPPLPPILPSDNITAFVTREWASFGDRVAICDGITGETRSFAELRAGVDSLAAHLAGLGLTAGQRVALVSPNAPDYATVLLAALQHGLTISPMNPTLTADEMAVQLSDAEIVMVLAHPLCPQAVEAAARVPSVRHVLSMGAPLEAITRARTLAPAAAAPKLMLWRLEIKWIFGNYC